MDNSDQKFESDLIKTVFLFDCIYSKTSPHYGSKAENDSAWLNVARTLLSPMTECVDKWHFLYQKFIHFSRLETKFGYDLLCSQWGHYQLFKAKQPEMASSYTELIVLKANTRKQFKDSSVRSCLIRHVECMENELLKPNTSCVRRQELWTEISNSLKKRFRLTQRCIMEWQMIWWEVKEELQKFLSADGKDFNQHHLRLIYLFQVNQIKDPDTQRKLSLNHEFDENVIESTCLYCPSTDSLLKDGMCNTCYEEFSIRCVACVRVKSTCSLATTGWRYRAKRLLPQSCRNKDYISLCSSCHSNLKERASCIWKVCRVCGENKHPLENLMHHSFEDAKQIFQTATGCEFRLSDGLPCFICVKCRDDFMDFVRFYVTFSNTQSELQDIQEKSLFGNEGVLRNAVYTNSKTDTNLPTPYVVPRTHSKRQRLRVEKNKYFSRHDRSKNEILIEKTDSSSDEASQTHPEKGNKTTSEQENASLSVPEVSDQSSASITENPLRLDRASGNKRTRSNEELDDGTCESQPKKISRNEERTDCVLVEDDNCVQTDTCTLPDRKRTFSISELSIEDLEDLDYLLNSNGSPSTSGLRASKSGNSNGPQCEEYVISDTSSNMSRTESETETTAPADDLVLKPDGTNSTCVATHTSPSESPLEPIQNPSQSLTEQNPSRGNSVPSKTTSNVVHKQLSPRRLTSEQSVLPDLRLGEDISITLIEKQPEQVLIETPPQSQPNDAEVIDLEVLNEKQTCEPPSNQNPLLIELLNRQAIEVTTSTITLPLNMQTATSTLPEKMIKVIDIETGSLIKNPDMGSKILGPNVISVTRSVEHSTTPSSNCGARVTRSSERSEMHVSKPTARVTRSSEQSAIPPPKPSTKVTTSLEPSAVPSSTVTRSSERTEMHVSKPITRVTRSSEEMAMPSPKLSITVSKSSEQSTISSAKPCTRRTRSWEKSAMTSSKPCTDVPKSDKKLLGEMLINCVLDKPTIPVEKEKVNIKRDKKLLGDMLKGCVLDKPTSSTAAAGVDQEMNKKDTREGMLADLNKPAESARIDTKIEVIQSKDDIPDTIRSSHSTRRQSSSTNTLQEIDTIIIRDDSPVTEPSASQIRDESLEIHSNSFMFLPEIVQSTEMRLHTDIALHKTLLIDDEDDDDGENVDVHIIEEEESCDELNSTDQVRHLHQSSLIDSVIERSFRTENTFLQIEEVFSLNADDRGVDQDKTSDL